MLAFSTPWGAFQPVAILQAPRTSAKYTRIEREYRHSWPDTAISMHLSHVELPHYKYFILLLLLYHFCSLDETTPLNDFPLSLSLSCSYPSFSSLLSPRFFCFISFFSLFFFFFFFFSFRFFSFDPSPFFFFFPFFSFPFPFSCFLSFSFYLPFSHFLRRPCNFTDKILIGGGGVSHPIPPLATPLHEKGCVD